MCSKTNNSIPIRYIMTTSDMNTHLWIPFRRHSTCVFVVCFSVGLRIEQHLHVYSMRLSVSQNCIRPQYGVTRRRLWNLQTVTRDNIGIQRWSVIIVLGWTAPLLWNSRPTTSRTRNTGTRRRRHWITYAFFFLVIRIMRFLFFFFYIIT